MFLKNSFCHRVARKILTIAALKSQQEIVVQYEFSYAGEVSNNFRQFYNLVEKI